MSGLPLVTISDEVDALNNYLELERLRFGEEFSYEVIIDERLDPDEVQLPSLMIQLFVENSLRHGLLHKQGKRWVKIYFDQVDETELRIAIDDNGIGRERAAEISAAPEFRHRSFGLSSAQERFQLLNETYGGRISLKIEDKRAPNGDANGTRIENLFAHFTNGE